MQHFISSRNVIMRFGSPVKSHTCKQQKTCNVMPPPPPLLLLLLLLLLLPFYGHYTGRSVLASNPGKNWRTLLEQRFTACMPLLMATSAFGLKRTVQSSPQWCYLHSLCTVLWCNTYTYNSAHCIPMRVKNMLHAKFNVLSSSSSIVWCHTSFGDDTVS